MLTHNTFYSSLIGLVFLCLYFGSSAQAQHTFDKSAYETLTADSIHQLAISIRRSDPFTAVHLLKMAQGKLTADSKLSTLIIYRELSATYMIKRDLDSSALYLELLAPLVPEGSSEQAELYNSEASIAYYRGDYDQAITSFLKANAIYVALEDKNGQSRILNNLGAISEVNKDYEGAERFFRQSIAVKQELGDSAGLSRSYNNLGLVLARLGKYEEAIVQYKKSVKIKLELNDQLGLSSTYNNMGIEYKKLNDYKNALKYTLMSLEIERKMGRDSNLVNAYDNLASIYFYLESYNTALQYADSAMMAAQKAADPSFLKDIYETYFEIYQAQGNYRLALDNFKQFTLLKDSLISKDRAEHLDELKEQFESEIKERKITALEQENLISKLQSERDWQLRIFLMLLVGLLGITLFLIYNRSRFRARSNKLLDEKNKELAVLNQTKDKLFAIISHDLKSPLSAFHTITASLESNWEQLEKEQIRDFIISLRDSSAEVYSMMDNLLRWALSQAGQMSFKPEKIDIGELIQGIENELKMAIEAKELVFERELGQKFDLYADKAMLSIVLRNLISNAIKFTNNGRKITVKAEMRSEQAIIKVMDQGVGMTEQDMARLFTDSNEVQKIKNSTQKGTGLGLMLCKELMEKHGGSISVKSEWGEGSVFKLNFPMGRQ